MTVLDFAMMVEDPHLDLHHRYRMRPPHAWSTARALAAEGRDAVDRLTDGISMVYSFYDPGGKRSLGTDMILEHIAHTRRLGLPYLYLGYWIQSSPKMSYKIRFQPQERLGPDGWVRRPSMPTD